nr:hypothetical protein [Micromonospora inyonensis]
MPATLYSTSAGLGEQPVGLGEQVVDLGVAGDDLVQVPLVREVGAAEDVAALPREDEDRSLVRGGLEEDAGVRGTRERVDDDVAALGAAVEPPARHLAVEDPVDPRSGGVDGDPAPDLPRPPRLVVPGPDAVDPPVRDEKTGHRGVGQHSRAQPFGVDQQLDAEALGPRHLGVVEEHPAAQPLAGEVGPASGDGLRGEAPAASAPPAGGQHVERGQAEPDQGPGPAVSGVERNEHGVVVDQVRRGAEQQVAFPDRFVHQGEVVALEVLQAAVDEPAGGGGGAGADVPPVDHDDAQAPVGGVSGDGEAVDAGTDDHEVDDVLGAGLWL